MLISSSRHRTGRISASAIFRWETLWGLPFLLVALYVVLICTELGTIVNHTWWSADSASAAVIGALYHQPPAGQYIILGDHGWFEAALFYVIAGHLPVSRAISYAAPVVLWLVTVALIAAAAGRAFGRYGRALTAGALLCVAPVGLMVVFQPTSHTNALFHAAALSLTAVWVLPRVRELSLLRLVVIAAALGLFSGLGVASDTLSLVWGPASFAVAVGVCAWRGPRSAVGPTLLFGGVTLAGVLISAAVFDAIVHGLGFRTDVLVYDLTFHFAAPSMVGGNLAQALSYLAYLVGGNFFGSPLNASSELALVIGLSVFAALGAVLVAVWRSITAAGERPAGGEESVSSRLVHVSFWTACLFGGVLMFVLGSPQGGVSRYLVGPLAALAALLPLAAARGRGWRIAVASGLSVVAAAAALSVIRTPSVPAFRGSDPLSGSTVNAVKAFAARWHAGYGYAAYWDAMTLTWYTEFGVKLYNIRQCATYSRHYCPKYQVSFTDSYRPRPGTRSLFIADPFTDFLRPDPGWGRPLATGHFGRLTVYVYPYDIASRFGPVPRGMIHEVLTGH